MNFSHDAVRNVTHIRHQFSRKYPGKKHATYWCTYWRSASCRAKLKVTEGVTGRVTVLDGMHTNKCCELNGSAVSGESTQLVRPDFTAEMKIFVDNEALKNLSIPPSGIWKMVCDEFSGRSMYYTGLTKAQVSNRVYNTRNDNCGGSEIQKLEATKMTTRAHSFVRFNFPFADAKAPQRIMGFAHPELLPLLKYPKI